MISRARAWAYVCQGKAAGALPGALQNCGTPAFAFSNIDEVGGGVPRQRPPPAQVSDFRIADQRAFPSHRVSVIYRSTGFPVIYGSTTPQEANSPFCMRCRCESRGLVLVPRTGGQFAEDREIDIVVRCLLRLISYPTNK